MTQGEIGAMIGTIQNIEDKLNQAAGVAVAVELRMRLIGELSEPVRSKLQELMRANRIKTNQEYWQCNLKYLEQAIFFVFSNNLNPKDLEVLESFRKLRNKLLHADFVGLMLELKMHPAGREADIREAIMSIDKQGLGDFEAQAKEVVSILDKLILSLAKG